MEYLAPFTGISEMTRVVLASREMLLVWLGSWIVFSLILIFAVYGIYKIASSDIHPLKNKVGLITFSAIAIVGAFLLTFFPLSWFNTLTSHQGRNYASAKVIRHYSGKYGKKKSGFLRMLNCPYYGINLEAYDFPAEHAQKWEMTEGWGKSLRMKVSKEEYEFIKDGAVLTFSYRLGRYFPFDVKFEQRPATQGLPPENQVIFEEVETPIESSNLKDKTGTPTGIKVN